MLDTVGNMIGISYEDTFKLKDSSSTLLGTNGLPVDTSEVSDNPQEIIITCVNKRRRVRGLLSEGIKISGKSEWQEMFSGGVTAMAGSTLQTYNNIDQLSSGSAIQQPWMNRKFWKSTKPFTFNFSMDYVAESDAEMEVFEPCKALLSFTFPRQTNYLIGEKWEGNGLIQTGLNSMSQYRIPGPSISYNGKGSQDEGDPVTIVIGNMFAFGGVYLEDVSIEFSPSFNSQGFPLAASVSITATAMDVNYCDVYGNFLVSQFKNSQADVSQFTNKMNETISQVGKDISSVWKSLISFWTGGNK